MAYLGKSKEREMYFGAKPDLFVRAHEMRKNSAVAEKTLWNHLRKFRKDGFIFRQQHPIDIFIADFYCHRIKLVIEVDGEIHEGESSKERDEGRTAELNKYGIKVIRFTNNEIIGDTDRVLKKINSIISELSSPALVGAGDKRG